MLMYCIYVFKNKNVYKYLTGETTPPQRTLVLHLYLLVRYVSCDARLLWLPSTQVCILRGKKIKLNKIGLQFLSIIAKSPTPSTVLL